MDSDRDLEHRGSGAVFQAGAILAVTLIPALSTWVFKGGVSEKEPLLARGARKLYAPLLAALGRGAEEQA